MAIPSFYDPERVGTSYTPQTAMAIAEGVAAALPPASEDERRAILLLVDPQVDFIHPDGALSVPGAVGDTRRTAIWIYAHTSELTAIAVSLDSHIPNQIFFSTWWQDKEGRAPDPYTPISLEEVQDGAWHPIFEPDWSLEYVRRLETEARKQLMIWPFHTMIGTPGHAVTPALYEAIAYHTAARRAQPVFITKGTIAKTEYYSLLEPEVPVPGDPQGGFNECFLEKLLGYDLIYIAGQAKSHCVLETLSSIMRRHGDDPAIVGKLWLLVDCTSSVKHPQIDFEALAEETLDGFYKKGLKRVESTDPIG